LYGLGAQRACIRSSLLRYRRRLLGVRRFDQSPHLADGNFRARRNVSLRIFSQLQGRRQLVKAQIVQHARHARLPLRERLQ
jgi:hypothetical protein